MRLEQGWVDKEFGRMVEANHFHEDVLVPVLADNSLVRHTLLYSRFLETRADEEDCKTELEKLLTSHYGLPSALSEQVFELCEENLKLSHECERWIEADDEA